MKLLLDTHTFLWFINGDANLSAAARQLIEDHGNERLLSIASLWEMAIKRSIGKLELDISFANLMEQHITGNAIDLLPIRPAHLDVLKTLSFHHRDPFDRLIIAQSIVENVPILSRDITFDLYPIERRWAT